MANKLDRFDAKRLIEAKKMIGGIIDYNYTSDSDRLYKKLNTIYQKLDRLLETELEPELQKEYDLLGRL